jgi:hypothetical protein
MDPKLTLSKPRYSITSSGPAAAKNKGEHLRRLEVDHQLDWDVHGKLAWLLAPQDAIR